MIAPRNSDRIVHIGGVFTLSQFFLISLVVCTGLVDETTLLPILKPPLVVYSKLFDNHN